MVKRCSGPNSIVENITNVELASSQIDVENLHKELATPEDRAKVVAVQLDHKLIKFTARPGTAVALTKKYGHFKNLDIKDTSSYAALVLAIADVRDTRTATTKEKTVIKAPALEWNKVTEQRAKDITEPLQELEDTLKLEKQRIDDIKADNKRKILEAQLLVKKTQGDNLDRLRNLYADTSEMTVDKLKQVLAGALPAVESLTEEAYGEYLEDAKAALGSIRIRLNTAIVQLEKAAKLEQQQQEAQKKLDDLATQEEADRVERQKDADKLKADQAEKDKETAEADAEKQKVIDDQAAQILALEEAAKPKPEHGLSRLSEMSDTEFSSMIDVKGNGKNGDNGYANQNQELSQSQIDTWLTKQGDDKTLETDIAMMTGFIRELEQAATLSPAFTSQKFTDASNRVVVSLEKACKFLNSFVSNAKETSK